MLDYAIGGIFYAGQRKEKFILGIVKFSERREIFLQPRLHSFDWAEQRYSRREKPGGLLQPFFRHLQPQNSLPKAVQSLRDLLEDEEIEEREEHSRRE